MVNDNTLLGGGVPWGTGTVLRNDGLGPGSNWGNVMALAGIGVQGAGAVTSAYAAYAQADANKTALKQRAYDLEVAGTVADSNARAAEEEAQQFIQSGKQEAAYVAARYGQEIATDRTRTAARGAQVGTGSAAELEASKRLAQRMDMLNIDVAATRAANAKRKEATNYRVQGIYANASAQSARVTARSVNPYLNAGLTLIGSAGDALSSIARYNG